MSRVYRVDLTRMVTQSTWTTVEVPDDWTPERIATFLRAHAADMDVPADEWEGGREHDAELRGTPCDVTSDYGPAFVVEGSNINRSCETQTPKPWHWIEWDGARWLCNGSSIWREGATLPTRAGSWILGHGRDLRPVDLGELLSGVVDGPGNEASLGESRDGLVAIVGGEPGWIAVNAAAALAGLRLRCTSGGKLIRSVLAFRNDVLVAVVPVRRTP